MKKSTKNTKKVAAKKVVVAVVAKGRPVNENSARQLRLKELAAKKEAGLLLKGRPVNPESARQLRLNELAEKKAAGLLKKGRPVLEGSARQLRMAELAAKAEANGGVIKRGRPAKIKEEVIAAEVKVGKKTKAKAKSVGTDEAIEIAAVEGTSEQ